MNRNPFSAASHSGLVQPMFDVQTVTLSNGMTLYFKPMPTAPRIAFGVYVFGGNRVETQPGYADMIGDLLVEGTDKRSAEQISLELDSLTLSLDVDTRRDYAMVSGTFLEEDLEASFELVGDLLFHSNLAQFEKGKIRMTGELMMELDSPSTQSYDLMLDKLLEKTPYRSSLTNILKHIPSYTDVTPLKAQYEQVFNPKNMLIAVVGNCSVDKIQTMLEKYMVASDRPGENCSELNALSLPSLTGPAMVTCEKNDSNQLHLFRGYFAPPISHVDYTTATMIHTLLGGKGLTSRLFLELRDKQGLAYHVRSQYEASKYMGIFGLYIGTEPSNRQKVFDGFDTECAKLMNDLVNNKELDDAKENLLGKKIIYLETALQQSIYLGAQLSMGMTIEHINTLNERVRAVTASDIQRVAQNLFGAPHVSALVGPASAL